MATSCPYCNAALKDDSPRFCASCGRPLGTPPPASVASAAVTTPDDAPAPAAAGGEEVLFEGRPAVLRGIGALLLAIITLGIAALVFWVRSLGKHYKITTQRVVIEHGVLSKRMEQIDLYRVLDYVVERPLGQRMLGTGNIVLEAADKTTPEVRIDGVKTDVLALYEKLRAATEAEKRRRGVRVLDMEH